MKKTNIDYSPKIVLIVNDKTSLFQIENAKLQGVSILEIRVDQFQNHDLSYVSNQIQKFKKTGLSLLGTIRSSKEGGPKNLSDPQRMALFQEIIPWLDWVDVEYSSKNLHTAIVAASRKFKTGLVFSFHDFEKTPSVHFLENHLKRCKSLGAGLVKIAVHAKTSRDVRRLLEFTLKHHSEGLVTISMGNLGAISRLFFGVAGSAWTYTFISCANAPGQVSLKELAPLIRRFYPK